MALTRFKTHIIMLGVVILLSATGILTAEEAFAGFSNSGMITVAAKLMIPLSYCAISGCCSIHQATRGLDLPVLTTIAASFALGQGLEKTGVAASLATNMLELGLGYPVLLIILTYVAISLLTEVITNNAAAILTLPIVLRVAESAQLDPAPFVITVMMAASASFATPLGYQTNLMVYGPGGYKFQDFLRVGIPMNIIVGVATVTATLLVWPLQ